MLKLKRVEMVHALEKMIGISRLQFIFLAAKSYPLPVITLISKYNIVCFLFICPVSDFLSYLVSDFPLNKFMHP
jgi:hypothetical protein